MDRGTLICVCSGILALAALAPAATALGGPDRATVPLGAPVGTDQVVAASIDKAPPAQYTEAPAAPGSGEPGNPLWALPLASFSSTRDRPLFSPSRRPPPLPVVAAAPAPPPPPPSAREPDRPQIVLVGTVLGQARDVAVLIEEKTKTPIRLRPGEQHDGWILRRVDRREVTFVKGRHTAALSLPSSRAEQPPAPDLRTETAALFPARHRKR